MGTAGLGLWRGRICLWGTELSPGGLWLWLGPPSAAHPACISGGLCHCYCSGKGPSSPGTSGPIWPPPPGARWGCSAVRPLQTYASGHTLPGPWGGAVVTTGLGWGAWPTALCCKAEPWLYVRDGRAVDGRHGRHKRAVQGVVKHGRADIGQDCVQKWLAQVLLLGWRHWGWWGCGLGQDGRHQRPTLRELSGPHIPTLTIRLVVASPPPWPPEASTFHSSVPAHRAWLGAGWEAAGMKTHGPGGWQLERDFSHNPMPTSPRSQWA